MIVVVIMMFAVPVLMVFLLTMKLVLLVALLVLTLLVTPMFVMMIAVSWSVDLVVPAIRYKIDGPSACVVFVAVPCPMSLMTRRHVQIQRRRRWRTRSYRYGHSDDRAGLNQLGCRNTSADADLAI